MDRPGPPTSWGRNEPTIRARSPPVVTRHVHLKLASFQFQVSMTSFSPACAMVLGAGPLLGVEIWIWAKF